jgi:hypothetical protein
MPQPKKHHFVPEMLLKRFCDGDGRLYFYDKAISHLGVNRTTPRNLFAETHLYSEIKKDGTRDAALEAAFSDLESRAEPIVEKLVKAGRASVAPNLSASETQLWHEFFYAQWRRVPDIHNRVVYEGEIEDYIDFLADRFRQIAPHRAAELAELETPEGRRRIVQNARVDTLSKQSTEVLCLLEERGLAVVAIRNLRKQFVVGSAPVVKLTTKRSSHIAALTTEVWLPVASDVMVGVGIGKGKESVRKIDSGEVVRRINQAIAGQSSVIAAASRALVESLANPV